jgi:two-component system sensor histidine kinase GlrK
LIQEGSTLKGNETYVLAASLCLFGAMAGTLIAVRLINSSLHSLEQVERKLQTLAESEGEYYVPETIQSNSPDSLVQAYNSFVTRIDQVEDERLKFMRMVSHDLRSSVASILSFAGLLSHPEISGDDASFANCCHQILSQGKEVNQFLDHLMNYVTLISNQHARKTVPLRLSDLVEDVIKEVEGETGQSIQFENQAGDVQSVSDPLMVRLMLINLLNHSLESHHDERPLSFVMRRAARPQWVEFHISRSNGFAVGSTSSILCSKNDAKENGSRPDPTERSLPLYLARSIAQIHKGKVTFETTASLGSVLKVIFPLQPELSGRLN